MSTNQRGMHEECLPESSEALFAIDPLAVKVGKEIGKGAFSVVFSGEYKKQQVAVKCQPKDASGAIPAFVKQEVSLLQRLHHPNLLHFIGAADNVRAKQVWILSEQVNNGDLDQLLRSTRKEECVHIGWSKMIHIALGIATGIDFLHARRVMHRDIKSSNVLLDNDLCAKLCDFGFATVLVEDHDHEETDSKGRRKSYCGTDAYMAPEMFLDEDYDESADVFSFGVVLMEMICCRPANADGFLMRLPQHKFRILNEEFRAAMPLSCPPSLASLAEQCVAFEPVDRPKSHEIMRVLKDLLDEKVETSSPVELIPYTPQIVECEPQIDDDNEEYSEDDEDDENDDDEDSSSSYDEDQDETDNVEDDMEEWSGTHEDVPESGSGAEEQVDLLSEPEGNASLPPSSTSPSRPLQSLAEVSPSLPPFHSGVILKRNRRGNRGWAQKWFVLDRGFLHYSEVADQQNEVPQTVSTLFLRECRIWKTMEMPELCFHVVNSKWKIKRELQALNRDDLDKWTIMINRGIDYANALPKTSSSHSLRSVSTVSSTFRTNGSLAPPLSSSYVSPSKAKHQASCSKSNTYGSIPLPPSKRRQAFQPQHQDPLLEQDDRDESREGEHDEVHRWLKSIGLQRFCSTLKEKGFASLEFIREVKWVCWFMLTALVAWLIIQTWSLKQTGIEKEDLNFLGIKDPVARKALTRAARRLRNE